MLCNEQSDEPDGGQYVESMLLVFWFCLYLVFGFVYDDLVARHDRL